MKTWIVLMALVSTGCARVWISEDMQQDESYKIVVDGNGYTSLERTKEEANRRAGLLCPRGYRRIAEIPEDNFKPGYTLVAKCN